MRENARQFLLAKMQYWDKIAAATYAASLKTSIAASHQTFLDHNQGISG